jgi:PAS domain S-box-containing protein
MESVSDGITVIDRAGIIVFQNRAATRMLGCETGGLVGQSLFQFVHSDDLPHLYSAFLSVVEEYQPDSFVQFRHRNRDGSDRMLEATVGKLRDATVAHVVLICRDLTRRRPAWEGEVRQTAPAGVAQARDRFLAIVSHELRTPLAPVLLGLDELQEDERFADARATIAMMRRNLKLQLRLIEDLNDLTAVAQQKVRLRLERIDAHEAVHFVLEICRSEIAAERIEVHLDLRAPESIIMADSLRIQQIIWNLVKNALKFSPPTSDISIDSANDAEGGLILQFADHGIGIEPELLPFVFNAFQQGDSSTPRPLGSLGLGLFIAKGLAEAQGGTLTASSEGRGMGSVFRLRFPKVPLAWAAATTSNAQLSKQ